MALEKGPMMLQILQSSSNGNGASALEVLLAENIKLDRMLQASSATTQCSLTVKYHILCLVCRTEHQYASKH